MTKVARVFPLALALTLSFAARGDAPADQYLTFTPVSPTISDHYTGLVWTRAPVQTNVSRVQYANAEAACSTLSIEGRRWRMPTVRELLTIVDELPHLEYDPVAHNNLPRAIDANAFPATPSGRFMAMSPDYANNLWFVDFSNGNAGRQTAMNDGLPYAVHCVAY